MGMKSKHKEKGANNGKSQITTNTETAKYVLVAIRLRLQPRLQSCEASWSPSFEDFGHKSAVSKMKYIYSSYNIAAFKGQQVQLQGCKLLHIFKFKVAHL